MTDLEDITRMLQIDVADWIDSYAIPTRDMVFRPYKLTEVHTQPAEAVKSEPEPVVEPTESKVLIADEEIEAEAPDDFVLEPILKSKMKK